MNISSCFLGREPLTEKELKTLQPIAMAFIGDTIFDAFLRSRLVAFTTLTPAGLHQAASKYANAGAQAQIMYRIEKIRTEEEHEIFRRGRNATRSRKTPSPMITAWPPLLNVCWAICTCPART